MTTVQVTVIDQDGRTGTVSFDVVEQTERERRSALVGVVKPDASTVGVYADVPRSPQSGATLTPGLLLQNKTITGRLSPPAQSGQNNPPAVLRNCELLGPLTVPASGDGILAGWGANHVPVVLEDCTIHAQALNYYRNGVMGHHITLRNCDVYDVVDGFDIFNSNDPAGATGVVVEGSWFHRSSYFDANPAGDANSQTHNDTGFQIMGGSGTRIVGNRVDGFLGGGAVNTHGTDRSNACIMIKPDVGTISDLVVEKNWLDGGRVPINIAQDAGSSRIIGTGIIIRDNVFGRSADAGPDYTALMPASASSVICTGNVYTDGTPAVIRRNG